MVETQLIASLRRNAKKGEHDYNKGANTIIERANTRFAPTSCVIECFVLGIGGRGLCGAQNQLGITNYELRPSVRSKLR